MQVEALTEYEKQERERKRKFDSQENLIKSRQQLQLAEIVDKQLNPRPTKRGFLASVFSRGR
jgi:hypothetical protein